MIDPLKKTASGLWEKSIFIILFFYYSGAFLQQFQAKAGIISDPSRPDPLAAAVAVPVYLLTLFLVSKRAGDIFSLLRKEKFMAGLLALTIISALWSDFPLLTLRRSAGLVCLTLFGVYVAVNYGGKERLKLFAVALGLSAIASFIFIKLLPSYGIDNGAKDISYAGAWKGIFVHKNAFGRVMAVGLIVFILLQVKGFKNQIIKWFFVIFTLFLLVFSRSATAILADAVLVFLVPVFKSMRAHKHIRIFTYCLYISAAIVVVMWLSADGLRPVLHAMGRDETFTGRTYIWEVVLDNIKKRPLFGYGYQAFWAANAGNIMPFYYHSTIPHSHNGFLDIWIDLGLTGLIIYIAGFLQAIRNSITGLRSTSETYAFWPIVFLAFIFMSSLTESPLLHQLNIQWLFYASVAVSPYINSNAQSPERL
ncbi:MAG: O-antigen ligase [Nitrospiraceae bacterium]|nr:O-antigen ligase [Nitrospiraceae bacterium]